MATVGVFICSCNGRISKTLNLDGLAEYAKGVDGVRFVKISDKLCLNEGRHEILDAVKQNKVEKIVIAACSPQVHELTFKKYVEEAGITPYCLDIANLREQCAYAHSDNPNQANEKAKALISASIERAKSLSGVEKFEGKASNSIVVIGGGIAGMHAASLLKGYGCDIYIIEREKELGGNLLNLHSVYPSFKRGDEIVKEKQKALEGVNIYTSSEVEEVSGGIGNFNVVVNKFTEGVRETVNAGAVILATGLQEYDASSIRQYGYRRHENVISQLELSKMLDKKSETKGRILLKNGEAPKSIAMFLCVGSRDSQYNKYCSKICCMYTIKHAIEIKEKNPSIDVAVFFMDIRTTGEYEGYFKKARELGVKFIRGKPASVVEDAEKKLHVDVENTLTGRQEELVFDMVVLSSALVPSSGTNRLSKVLNIELTEDGFYRKLYPKLRTVETRRKGVYICGGAAGPKDVEDAIIEAGAAALKAVEGLKVEKDLTIATVNEELCIGCETCVRVCPHNAVTMYTNKEGKFLARINSADCRGCGSCAANCPTGAVQLTRYSREQMFSYIEGLLKEAKNISPAIVNFSCYECGYAAIDLAGKKGFTYPANVMTLRVPCAGRVSMLEMLKAFEAGADGVLLVGCGEGGCQYLKGNTMAEAEVEMANTILEEIGWGRRIESCYLYGAEADEFAEKAREVVKKIEALGPNPKRKM